MQSKYLKKIRVLISLVFFILTVFIFIDFTGWISNRLTGSLLYLQFVPSLLKFIGLLTVASAGFLFIVLLTFFFGRVYCSTVCPLGTLQDIFSWISNKTKISRRFTYSKPKSIVRYSILGGLVLLLFIPSIFLLNLLDPYSLAGKIFSNLFRPLYYLGNNMLARVFQSMDNYSLYSVQVKVVSWAPVLFSFVFLLVIFFLAVFKGRWYCNVICPVGTSLGILSKISFFRIAINEKACTSCGMCSKKCKSECIDVRNKKIDFSRCVACFDCFRACPEDGIGYRFSGPDFVFSRKGRGSYAEDKETELSRRKFIRTTILGTTAIFASKFVFGGKKEERKGISTLPVTPPGSVSIWHYTEKCTACHLCVSACPTKVLQPTFMEFGISGMFQPRMDFHTEYCNFECVKCSEVCPTGAILPLTKAQKSTVQIGTSKFIKNLCIVVTKHTACGACSEHCPTKAVEMVPYLGTLTLPKIDEKICVGCGACEFACPTKPDKAIYVEANPYHRKAMKPKKNLQDKKQLNKATGDFPF